MRPLRKKTHKTSMFLLGANRAQALALLLVLLLIPGACSKDDILLSSGKSDFAKVSVRPVSVEGDTLKLLYQWDMAPEWHIYWINPGDAGLAPKFGYDSSVVTQIVQTHWPAPHRLGNEVVVSYGFGETVFITQEVLLASTEEPVDLAIDLDWLECKEECLPAKTNLVLHINDPANFAPIHAEALAQAVRQRPKEWMHQVRGLVREDTLSLDFGPSPLPEDFYVYPAAKGWYETTATQKARQSEQSRLKIDIPVSSGGEFESSFAGVFELRATAENDSLAGFYSFQAPVLVKEN